MKEAYKNHLHPDAHPLETVPFSYLDQEKVQAYLTAACRQKPNLSALPAEQAEELLWIHKNQSPTLLALLLFGLYPQSVFPQLAVTAVAYPGTEVGETTGDGRRYYDSRKLEGTLQDMLEGTMRFFHENLKTGIRVTTGERENILEIPEEALREAVLNALIHRDYSEYALDSPVQVLIFKDRVEIISPGGLYGKSRLPLLGIAQPDTRNTALVSAMETLKLTENRFTGIPTIRRTMKKAGLPEPIFKNEHGTFSVILSRETPHTDSLASLTPQQLDLLQYLSVPRSRKEISSYLGYKTPAQAIKTHVLPLMDKGSVLLTEPDNFSSKKQRFYANPDLRLP